MARLASLTRDLELNQTGFPKQYITPLTTRDHILIGQHINGTNVTEVRLAEATQFTLQLQTGESVGHFPKFDMTEAAGRQEYGIEV